MSALERTWALVLAGGGADPPELRDGHGSNPDRHQFGGLLQPQSLLKMTLSRACVIVPRDRIVLLVNRAQECDWSGSLKRLSFGDVIVQPRHRGSAVEILLAVLTILKRDPWARILVLPAHTMCTTNQRWRAASLTPLHPPRRHATS
jgi:mannose-1-phosphate guanylyltransferase